MERRLTESTTALLTRQSGTNFYAAFLMLPPAKRQALYALYAFCRVVDDCVDEAGGGGAAGLDRWAAEVERIFAGRPDTEIGRALAASLERFPMPRSSFLDVIDGCRMDIAPRTYTTFDELRVYCERVASSVGLASIEIFGYREAQTREYARELGIALQLINILRDLTSDARQGRLYVPVADLEAAGVKPAEFSSAAARAVGRTPAIDEILTAQGDRARAQYDTAVSLLPAADRRSMRPAQVMAATYREILERLAARRFPFGPRVHLPKLTRAWVAFRTVARESFA